ncbi:hypothetical protein Tco_0327729 [Tanacetum coccineum]
MPARHHNIEPTVGGSSCYYTLSRTSIGLHTYTTHTTRTEALFWWHTDKSVSNDPPPKSTDFNAEHYAMLVAHPAPFRKFPEHVAAETEIVKKVARHHKKRPAAADVSGSNHPPKKLREDYGTSGGHASGGKSPSVIRELLESCILNAEVGVAAIPRGGNEPSRSSFPPLAIPTLPFVTSFVFATPEKDGDDFTDAVTGPNLRTIGPSVRFVISPDSSHHSSTKATEAEVESIPRSADPPIMTEAVVTTEAVGVSSYLFPKTVVDTSSRFGPDLFLDSDSADTERPVTASTAQRPGRELSMGSREVDSEALHETFVPRWNVPNDTLLDEHDISREFIDHLAPPVLFSQIRNMDYHHLFTEFNVGTARQACLNAEVRMRTEFCLSERTRLEVECGRQASLLKSKDEEIEVLKAQLTVKEAEAAEAIRLRAQIVAMERAHTDEVDALQHNNAVLEGEKNTFNDKVNVLEGACSELREQVSAYESLKEQIEEFQDEQMRVMFDKLAKLEGRELEALRPNNPSAAEDYDTALRELRAVEFSLLADLKSNKDASTETVMDLLRLSDPLANLPGMSDLQPDVEQLMVPIHRPEDQVVLGASSLTFSLSVSRDRVERIRRNIAEHRSALAGVFAPLAEPFSVQSLNGAVNTSDVAPSAVATTTALSTTFSSAITIPPVSVDDYVVADMVNEENVQPNVEYKGEGSAAAINFEKEELDTTP